MNDLEKFIKKGKGSFLSYPISGECDTILATWYDNEMIITYEDGYHYLNQKISRFVIENCKAPYYLVMENIIELQKRFYNLYK